MLPHKSNFLFIMTTKLIVRFFCRNGNADTDCQHHVQLSRGRLDGTGQNVGSGRSRRPGTEPVVSARHGRARNGPGLRTGSRNGAQHQSLGPRRRQDSVLRQTDAQRHQHRRHRPRRLRGRRRRRHRYQHCFRSAFLSCLIYGWKIKRIYFGRPMAAPLPPYHKTNEFEEKAYLRRPRIFFDSVS